MKREESKITVISSLGDSEETLDVLQFPDGVPVAHVDLGFGFGQTVNTGDYSSMRYDVRVSMPCYVEEIDEAFNVNCGSYSWKREAAYEEHISLDGDGDVYDVMDCDPVRDLTEIRCCGCGLDREGNPVEEDA